MFLLLAAFATAQTYGATPPPPPAPPPGPIAMERVETQGPGRLTVSSPSFGDGQPIPARYSRYYSNVSPPLRWTAVRRARTYALIVDDPDGKRKPVTHWTAWNLTATRLPEQVPTDARLDSPAGVQGTTTMGSTGYAGPHPPLGDPPHHYHFQVFALDMPLSVPPAADRETLLAAMKGHVLARGELIGLYAQGEATGK